MIVLVGVVCFAVGLGAGLLWRLPEPRTPAEQQAALDEMARQADEIVRALRRMAGEP